MEVVKKLYWMIVSTYVSIIIFLFSSIYNQFAEIGTVPLYSSIKINEHLSKSLYIDKTLVRYDDSIQVVFNKIINNDLDVKLQSDLIKTFSTFYKENLLNVYHIEEYENWIREHPDKRSKKMMPTIKMRKDLCNKQNEILDLFREYLYYNKAPFQKLKSFRYKYYCLFEEYQTLNNYKNSFIIKKDNSELFFKIISFFLKLFFKLIVISFMIAFFVKYLIPAGNEIIENIKSSTMNSENKIPD